MATLIVDQDVSQNKQLFIEEKRESYDRERGSLTSNHAFVRISKEKCIS